MKQLGKWALCGVAALLMAGCSTPESRIKQHPDMFASFSPDIQARVRQGQVDVGFNKDMVFIALGEPQRKYSRTTATGASEVWSYVGTYTTTERQLVTGDFRVRSNEGIFRTVHDSAWVDVQQEHEYEQLRVEFENNQVKAVERIER